MIFLLEFVFEKKVILFTMKFAATLLSYILVLRSIVFKPDDEVDMSIRVFFAPILLDSILSEFSVSQNRFLMTIVSGSLIADTTL